MTDFINLTCPTCGGTIESLENNQFICQNCRNKYLLKQDGSQINLVPLVEEKGTLIEGNHNVVVNVSTGAAQAEAAAVHKEVECPICGKIVPLNQTFRCKRCGRSHICTSHQDPKSYLCQECMDEAQEKAQQSQATLDSIKPDTRENKSISGFSKFTTIIAMIIIGISIFFMAISGISEIAYQNDRRNISLAFYHLAYITFWIHFVLSVVTLISGIITWAKGNKKSGQFGIGAFILSVLLSILGQFIIGA